MKTSSNASKRMNTITLVNSMHLLTDKLNKSLIELLLSNAMVTINIKFMSDNIRNMQMKSRKDHYQNLQDLIGGLYYSKNLVSNDRMEKNCS